MMKMNGIHPSATAAAPVMNDAIAIPRGAGLSGRLAVIWLIGASTYR